MRDRYNIVPVFMAAILHAAIFAVFFVAINFSRPVRPAVPLAINATLISDQDLVTETIQVETPPEEAPDLPPEPEPEPEPEVDEPEPEPEPEIDTEAIERARLEAEARAQAEEEKRQADLAAEQERVREQQEADRQRREAEEAERQAREEQERERQREQAEKKRLEDLERQRAENERKRREAEQAEIARRQAQEVQAEQNRLDAARANDVARWVFRLQQAISREFVPPASSPPNLECIVDVRLLPGGTVAAVSVGRCNGDDTVRRAIEAAVDKASPLPMPQNPSIFERDLRITFKPEQ